MGWFSTLLRDLGLLGALLVLLGFGGAWVPALDTLALIRPVGAALCLVGLLSPARAAAWAWRRPCGVPGLPDRLSADRVAAVSEGHGIRLGQSRHPQGNAPGLFQEPLVRKSRRWTGSPGTSWRAMRMWSCCRKLFHLNAQVLDKLAEAYPHQHACSRAAGQWGCGAVAPSLRRGGAMHRAARSWRWCLHGLRGRGQMVDGSGWPAAHLPWLWRSYAAATDRAALDLLAGVPAGASPSSSAAISTPFPGPGGSAPWRVRRVAVSPGRCAPRFSWAELPAPLDMVLAPGGGRAQLPAASGLGPPGRAGRCLAGRAMSAT